ncbi:MAG: hypothetical protein C0467_25515 [Planctomycetaceae bacterium]|nr:hypothetical protein [Planctomycetaceae bacterium]
MGMYAANLTKDLLKELAERISVPMWALESFQGIGWNAGRKHWTLPCVDGEMRVIGLATRSRTGHKEFIRGTKTGPFVSPGWRTAKGDIHIVEGQTDTIHMSAAGLVAIGRPGAKARIPMLAALLKNVPESRRIIVVGEWDWQESGRCFGRAAAYAVAVQLSRLMGRVVYWSMPPRRIRGNRWTKWIEVKDAREWFTARAEVKDTHPDMSVRALRRATHLGTPVTQSRSEWKRLGKDYAAAVLAQAVAVHPEPADAPFPKREHDCRNYFTAQMRGKTDTTAKGKRAAADLRCLRWGERCWECTRYKANRHSAWAWRCIFAAADPLRIPHHDTESTDNQGERFPWPDRPDHTIAGPWTLHAAIVDAARFRTIQNYLYKQGNAENGEPLTAFRVVRMADQSVQISREEIRNTNTTNLHTLIPADKPGPRYLIVVGIAPQITPPPGLTAVSADDAAELLDTAHHSLASLPDDAAAERQHPVSASKNWQLPETVLRSSRWAKEAKAGVGAKRIKEVTDRLTATDQGDGVHADAAQTSTVRRDSAVGGELLSWFLAQTLTPEHATPQLDIDEHAARFAAWRAVLDGITDGLEVRDYLAANAGKLPDQSDRDALIAAADTDRFNAPAMAEGQALREMMHRSFTMPTWATEMIQAGQDRIKNGERVGIVRTEIAEAINAAIERDLAGYMHRHQIIRAATLQLRKPTKTKRTTRPLSAITTTTEGRS